MAKVEAYLGPYASKRVDVIDRLFHTHAPHGLLLMPTTLSARRRLERLLLTGPNAAFWGSPPVQTFQDFVERLLHGSDCDVVPLSPLAQRLLLEEVIARLHGDGKLDSIGAAAETPGFVSHVQRTIAQLKQAAVEPEAFAKRTATRDKGSRLDALVAEVYSAYQQALLDQNAYDREGLYWEAALLCDAGRPKGLADVQTLILDGFDEFTAAQFRLLEKLAPHLGHLVFGLEASLDIPMAEDTYQVPLATHKRLRQAFSTISECTLPESPAKSYSDFAAARVFWREQTPLPQDLTVDISVQRCVNPLHELEYIGREIKHLLLDGKAHITEIAVVFPDLPSVLDAGTSVFRELGLPIRCMTPRSLFDTSLGGFLLGLFDAFAAWQRDHVLKLMTSPWMAGAGQTGETSAAFPLIARVAKIIAGRDAWRDGLDGLSHRMTASRSSSEISAFKARIPEPEAAIAAARETLAVLARIETMIPQQATAAEFATAISDVLQSLQVEGSLAQLPTTIRPAETAALEALHSVLDELRRTHESNGGLKTSRNTFASQLRSLLNNAPCQTAQPKDAILWLDLENVRHLTFPFVFFLGANEGAFPRRTPVNAIYSERDIADLARAGIDLRGTSYYIEHEMNLFRHLLATASNRLTITYGIHSNDGKAALRSPFLDD
ncbi:MAG: exodeoxyribonuclease V subunit gamma, partial [Candidatus Hydrogenedentes bacterium]|nr:exodeoxyribonuclease V subunit gamma [Candidatus Hydrogenedentota bacterium]